MDNNQDQSTNEPIWKNPVAIVVAIALIDICLVVVLFISWRHKFTNASIVVIVAAAIINTVLFFIAFKSFPKNAPPSVEEHGAGEQHLGDANHAKS